MLYEKHFKNLLDKTCKRYKVEAPELKFSGKLKRANGTCSFTYNKRTNEVYGYKITISKHLFEYFPMDIAEETLYHEIAHYIDHVKNGKLDHGPSFKKLCVELGGTMNSKIAGNEYSMAASSDYISDKIGYLYTCPCGFGRKQTTNRISKKMLGVYCCPKCNTKIKYFNVKEL